MSEKEEKIRFITELEFVQLLANPAYLNCMGIQKLTHLDLAQFKYFENPAFLNYCKYLGYWKKPEYSKFIVYPHALYFLDQINESEVFREECKKREYIDYIAKQQGLHWQYYRRNREQLKQ